MKKLIIYCLLAVFITSCKEHVYTTKYHSPSTLFDKNQFIKTPNYWQYYIHEPNGETYKARSGSFNNNSLEAVIVKTKTIEIPDTLHNVKSLKKKEIHIYVKDSIIESNIKKESTLKRLKIHENDIIEVVSYMNPVDVKNEKRAKNNKGAAVILSMIVFALGLLTLSVIIISNAINNTINNARPSWCFVAKMIYGSCNAPEVLILRRFRDERLNKTYAGKIFIGIYYTLSPIFVKCFKNVKFVNRIIKSYLDRYVIYLKGKHNW